MSGLENLGLRLFVAVCVGLGCSDAVPEDAFDTPPEGSFYETDGLNFGPVSMAKEASLELRVSNPGTDLFRVLSTELIGDADSFSIEIPDVLREGLAPGGEATLMVTYRACTEVWTDGVVAENADFWGCPVNLVGAVLQVFDSANPEPTSISLQGRPLFPLQPGLKCTSVCNDRNAPRENCEALSFGNVGPGGDPCDLYLRIETLVPPLPGVEAAPLVLESARISVFDIAGDQLRLPGPAAGFSITDENEDELALPLELPFGTPWPLLRVRFSGIRAGVYVGTRTSDETGLRLGFEDGTQKIISITAVGSGPDIDLTDRVLAFGPVSVGEQATLSVEIINRGDAPLELRSLQFASGLSGLSARARDGSPLAPRRVNSNERLPIDVTYRPLDEKTDRDELCVESNDPDESPACIQILVGPRGELCDLPQVLSFPRTAPGTPVTQTLELENCGSGSLKIERLELASETPPSTRDDFSLRVATCTGFPCELGLTLCPSTSPGCSSGSLTVPVIYQNTDASVIDLATLIVTTSDALNPQLSVSLNAE